jgi:hypothetical protein
MSKVMPVYIKRQIMREETFTLAMTRAVRYLICSTILFFLLSIGACTKDNKPLNPKPTPAAKQLSISDLKNLSSAQPVTIKDVGVIRGVVISDGNSQNVDDNKVLFLQEGSNQEGIMLTLQMDHNFALNDSLEIYVSGLILTRLKGAAVLENVPNNLVKKLGVGKIAPRETSLSELQVNRADWEGSVVRIKACEFISDNGKYNTTLKIRDGNSTIVSKIFEKAKFNGQQIPDDVSSLVGIVRLNGDEVQLAPRNASDIQSLKFTIEDFTTWKNTTWTFNLAKAEIALHTRVANWSGDLKDGAIKQSVFQIDGDFTTSGKLYPYLPKDSIASKLALYPVENSSFKGLTVVRVTFAASKSTGNVRFQEQSVGDQEISINVLPFSTGIDEVKVGVEIPIVSTGELVPGKLVTPKGFDDYYRLTSFTPALKTAGKFYTATFFVPSTMEDLTAMGITSGNRLEWLKYPRLKIINLSSRKTKGITDRNRDRYVPILIDKVELGF